MHTMRGFSISTMNKIPSFSPAGARAFHSTYQSTRQIITWVQLDDQVLGDLEVDVFLGRNCADLALEGVLIPIQPLGGGDKASSSFIFLKRGLETLAFANGHQVTHLYQEGGMLTLAIDGKVAMVHQLPGLPAGEA